MTSGPWLSQDAYELRETLKLARGFYAKAPDHSRFGWSPVRDRYCPVTACYVAASQRVSEGTPQGYGQRTLTALASLLPRVDRGDVNLCVANEALIRYNASHTTEEVLVLFDQAIEAVTKPLEEG
jgi:hypothetical protein